MVGNLKDLTNLLSKLTYRKVYHGSLLLVSYIISKSLKRVIHFGLPLSISVEPTTSCNLRCPECPSGLRSFTRNTGMLDYGKYKLFIDDVKNHLWYLLLYFQGEPYLHQDFFNMIAYANKKGIYTATSTNGHYLDLENAKKTVESGLDRLVVSLDGTDQDTYSQYRVGGKLEKVLDGVQNIMKAKKDLKSSTPNVIFQFLVVKPNEHQIEEAEQLAKSLGVDEIRFKTAQIYDFENGSSLMPDNPKYSRYRKTNKGQYEVKNYDGKGCWTNWHSCVVTWDGKMTPCCFDKDATYSLGNVFDSSFPKVWNSVKHDTFRRTILKDRKAIDICSNCTEGMSVWR